MWHCKSLNKVCDCPSCTRSDCKFNLYAGFESHSHLQAGLASLAGTPHAVTSFLKQAHAASRHQVYAPVCGPLPGPSHPPHFGNSNCLTMIVCVNSLYVLNLCWYAATPDLQNEKSLLRDGEGGLCRAKKGVGCREREVWRYHSASLLMSSLQILMTFCSVLPPTAAYHALLCVLVLLVSSNS